MLPILIVLIFGIIYGGIAYNRQLALTQAAREGSRFAATLPFTGEEPDTDWFSAVKDRTVNSSTGSLTASDANVCVRFVDEDGTPSGGDCGVDADAAANRARVEVAVQRPAELEFIFYSFPVTLRAESVGRYEPEVDS